MIEAPVPRPGWTCVSKCYGFVHWWKQDGSRVSVFCQAGPDSFDRARAMLAGDPVPFVVFRQEHTSDGVPTGRVTLFDQRAVAEFFELVFVPPAGAPDPAAAERAAILALGKDTEGFCSPAPCCGCKDIFLAAIRARGPCPS